MGSPRQLAAPVIAVMVMIIALTVVPWIMNRQTESVGIEDIALHNASSEEQLILSNEELSQAKVSPTILPSGR